MFGQGGGKMIIGLVMIALAIIIFPIVLSAVSTILADANIADYTGLSTLVAITPVLLWIGLIAGGGLLTFQGVRGRRKAKAKARR